MSRPFYTEFAWAYDLVISSPVVRRCDFVESVLSGRGFCAGSTILDAGCGTGSYSVELARRGYRVTGIDASPELVSVARKKAAEACLRVAFRVGDILRLSTESHYDGVLCRGVLNDVIEDRDRQKAFLSFARVLSREGALILDVREWHSSALRKEQEPAFEKVLELDRGTLTFRSVARLDYDRQRLLVSETHIVEKNGEASVAEYDFVMRCWTEDELENSLANAGFDSVVFFGDYDCDVPVGATDRIVAVAVDPKVT